MDLLIHGVYDAPTLATLQGLNVSRIAFDLRARSVNLIPFHTLQKLLPLLKVNEAYLIFEDDKFETIHSFLDLLGEHKNKFQLELRDSQDPTYYASLNHPFTWVFNPDADWMGILNVPQLKSLILPVKYKHIYQNLPQLWQLIEHRRLPIFLHLDSFADLELYVQEKNLTLSVDLGKEMEMGFRKIDQFRLLNLRIWRPNYEITPGQ